MATAAEVRWLHYSAEERMGKWIPARGRDGHMQYVPRAPGDGARLSPDELERMLAHYTRLDASRLTNSSVDTQMYRERDPREVESIFNAHRVGTRNQDGAPGEFTRAVDLGSGGDVQQADPSFLDEHYRAKNKKLLGRDGYFGEAFLHMSASKDAPRLMALRNFAIDGVHNSDGTYRSIRDLVSQLWFDDGDEACAGAMGICDLTIPSNAHAPANRELIGATPTVFEGLERLLRSGSPNTAYHAAEALSQLAFRNNRNGQRIMTCFAPHMRTTLSDLLVFDHVKMDDDSRYELRAAVLRVLNNCAWNSRQVCVEVVEDSLLMDRIENLVSDASTKPFTERVPVPLLMALDASVGLLNHLSTEPYSRDNLLRRRVAEDVLLPMVAGAEELTDPPEQYLCTVAGAVEVIIKLIWDAEKPPFVPHGAVLQTIVWTLVCALDGVMWAGITWSSLGRVQTLSKIAQLDVLKVQLIDLNLVETLVRLLNQWTQEQGLAVLEHALLTLLHLLTFEEARFRMYTAGVYRPFRSIVLGDEGASEVARERAVLCSWLLFEWQVDKLEMLDKKVKDLMKALEDSERGKLKIEDEFARVRQELMDELARARGERDMFREKFEFVTSELDATSRALQREQSEREAERVAGEREIERLKRLVDEKDGLLGTLRDECGMLRGEVEKFGVRAADAEGALKIERAERERAEIERQRAYEISQVRYRELQIESVARATAEKQKEAHRSEFEALAEARDKQKEVIVTLEKSVKSIEEVSERRVCHLRDELRDSERRGREAAGLLGRLVSRDKRLGGELKEALRREALLVKTLKRCMCGACFPRRKSIAGAWGFQDALTLAAQSRCSARQSKSLSMTQETRPLSAPVSAKEVAAPTKEIQSMRWGLAGMQGFQWEESEFVDARVSRRTRGEWWSNQHEQSASTQANKISKEGSGRRKQDIRPGVSSGSIVGKGMRDEGGWEDGGLPKDVRELIDSWRKTLPAGEIDALREGVKVEEDRYEEFREVERCVGADVPREELRRSSVSERRHMGYRLC